MLSILGLRLLPVFSRSGRIASIYTGPQVSCLSQEKKQIARGCAREWKLSSSVAAGELCSRCSRSRAQAHSRETATVHDCLKSDRPRGYGHRYRHSLRATETNFVLSLLANCGLLLASHLLGRPFSTWRASQSVIYEIDIFSSTLRNKQLGGHFLFARECFGRRAIT